MRRLISLSFAVLVLSALAAPAEANHGGPHSLIASGPPPFTSATTATFTFTAYPYEAQTCSLDGGTPTDCGSQKTYTNLAAGTHTLDVSGTQWFEDYSGCGFGGPCPETFPIPESDQWTWRIDVSKPTAALTAPVPWAQLGSTASVKWTGSDTGGAGIKNFTLARKRAPYNGNFGAVSYAPFGPSELSTSASLAAGSTDCFAIRATDNVENVGAFSSWRCITLPLDDRALARSSGWTQSSSSVFFNSTATYTRSAGAIMGKTGAQVRRIGLVVTKCATCGSVTVKVDSATIGTASLYSSTTKYKQLVTLPSFSFRSGTVRVITTTSGKTVQLDGLALTRQ